MGQPFDVVKHQHLPRAVRETADRAFQVNGHITDPRSGRCRLVNPVETLTLRPPTRALPDPMPVRDEVEGDATQPAAERTFAPEAAEALPGSNEDLLRDVLGVLSTDQHSTSQRVDLTNVRPIDQLEGVDVTVLGAGHPKRFVGLLAFLAMQGA